MTRPAPLIPRDRAAALPAPDPAPAARWADLAADLTAADYTNRRIVEILGSDAAEALAREQIVPGRASVLDHFEAARAAEESPHPCAVLSGLYLLGLRVTAGQVDAALPRLGFSGLCELGLAFVEDGTVQPATDLRPYTTQRGGDSGPAEDADLWVLSDLGASRIDGSLPTDHVLGVGGASLTLAGTVHRRRVDRALDLGTGCGIQLFHLLDHAEHVVGTDVSQRALDFTRCNLLLNASGLGLDADRLDERVELRRGSLLEPVSADRFDLVVSNPPFVITPRSADPRYTYRDGGRPGDELMADLIRGVGEVLAPGGTVQMLGNWEIITDADWSVRPRTWVEDGDLHAWFLQRDEQTPAQYAETWLRDASGERDLTDYRRRYAEYLADFGSRDVTGVGFGLIWLRRGETDHVSPASDGAAGPWRRFEEVSHAVDQPLGPAIGGTAERALAVAEDPDAVLARPLVAAEDVTEERHQRFGASDPEVILARQGAGLRRVRPVSSAAAGLLGAADGEFAAGQLITAVTALLDDGDTDLEALTVSLRAEVLELYTEGFLTD
ncbi:DUF7059 domain-containing protein [Nesterenkonia marinintestina]|uniref:DUF7059 domain-containing protein n=1 Tax=Nesterenkonia marinintestina TaxID=2979865 RepID=UPI0021BF2B95|nr:methyltransferase [Nesterenkonia sp. GX14115]